jgi:hypothetical protein
MFANKRLRPSTGITAAAGVFRCPDLADCYKRVGKIERTAPA